MRVQVTTRDGANHYYDNVLGVRIQEPGQETPMPLPGMLIISAAAVIAWMVLPDESNPQSDGDTDPVRGPARTSQAIDLIEGGTHL